MGKLLLLLAVGAVVWLMWRNWRLQDAAASKRRPAERPAESMVACAYCGVNQPRSESVESNGADGRWYCSEAHRSAAEGGDSRSR